MYLTRNCALMPEVQDDKLRGMGRLKAVSRERDIAEEEIVRQAIKEESRNHYNLEYEAGLLI